MPGPVVQEPAAAHKFASPLSPAGAADAGVLLQIMSVLHSNAVGPAFNALQLGKVENQQGLALAHVFEEIGALVLHRLVNQDLLFDAFAFDVYWKSLSKIVLDARKRTGNDKFGENFQLMAELAADYREQRPSKTAK